MFAVGRGSGAAGKLGVGFAAGKCGADHPRGLRGAFHDKGHIGIVRFDVALHPEVEAAGLARAQHPAGEDER